MIDLRFQPMQQRPAARPGQPFYIRSPFKGRTPMDELERELKLLKATDVVIESGHDRMQIRNDGWPRGGSAPAHQDVRLYFKCKHGSLRYECNTFDSWEANLRAIGLWMQRQRLALEEWGIGSGGEAYRGFTALPSGGSIAAAEFANVTDAAAFLFEKGTGFARAGYEERILNIIKSEDTRRAMWRDAAKRCHPDITRDNGALMSKVNRARDLIEASR